MVPLYSLFTFVDMADICYNRLLWVMVVIVLCISLPFCYVIVHRNICRNPSFSVAKSLCHKRWQLDTLFSLYVSDSIVSFILNRIVSIDPMTTTTTTTIRQSHHRPMGLLMYQIVLFRVSIITVSFLIHCPSRSLCSFCYGRYSCDEKPRGHRPMGLLMYQIVLFLVSIITVSLLIHYSSRSLRSFCYGRYSCDQKPRGNIRIRRPVPACIGTVRRPHHHPLLLFVVFVMW